MPVMRDKRVLAVEPDPLIRSRLEAVLRSRLRQPAQITATAEDAIRAIERQLPDLVLTSSLLRPAEVDMLTDHLSARDDTSHIPILITPHLAGAQQAPASGARHLWRTRRSSEVAGSSDTDAFLRQLDDYFAQADAAREAHEAAALSSISLERPALRLVHAPTTALVPARPMVPGREPAQDRRRAPRARRDQLPWLRIGRLPWGSEVDVVDVSSSGVLLETTTRMTPGALVDLEFLSNDLSTTVQSRIVRTEVAHVDRLGVRYRNAATFTREFRLGDAGHSPDRASSWKAVGEILTRALADVDCGSSPASIRARFERELQQLVPACTVRIRQGGSSGGHADQSIYFTIPSAQGPAVLEVTFDGSRPPSRFEFQALQSSAYLAAALLDSAAFARAGALRARA